MSEKKPRKKWTHEETMMLVNGCQIHGVGNWKTILQDPNLQFHDRTAVDLKDRFRTYFPDAYKKHYPNAKTHLSNKVRSTFPDGTSLFEKTRSKRRRPFSEAEDAALKAGYEKHGTTWATIVKDPIFQEQNRRSTDLRDRFRNAFPHLYQAAGYKPRSNLKKKTDAPMRAADDNLSQMSTAGPVRSRRKAQSTRTGYLRGGTKSVPQSTACSEDEDSSAGEDEDDDSTFKRPATPVLHQDWFSNPLSDASSAASTSSFIDNSFSPASPFSFHPHLSQGVLDRYDLFPPSMPTDICSDAGIGDSDTNFSDDYGPGGAGGGIGFKGYHSQFAGDLISGVGSRMPSFASLPSLYEPFGGGGSGILGLGLEGIPEDAGIHPMQLDGSPTTSFVGIGELGLTDMSLNDTLEAARSRPSTSGRSGDDLDDLVDLSNNDLQHETPPATPIMPQSRPLRRSSHGAILDNFEGPAAMLNSGHYHHHHRSISVPPSEARNAGAENGDNSYVVGVSMDDVGVHMHSPVHGQHTHPTSPPQMSMGKGFSTLFDENLTPALGLASPSRNRRGRRSEPMALTNIGGGGGGSSVPQLSTAEQPAQQPTQITQIFSSQHILEATSSIPSTPNARAEGSKQDLPHVQVSNPWRASANQQTWMNPHSVTSSDVYNVPYLDLHYSYGGNVGLGLGNLATMGLHDLSDARQGQEALDLAQSAALTSSGLGLTSLGLNLAFMGAGKPQVAPTITNSSSSPAGTLRTHRLAKQPLSPPSDTFGSVAAAIAAANAVGSPGRAVSHGAAAATTTITSVGLNALDLTGTGTVRQSHSKSNASSGRSMSHHRGQSAICPLDLELRVDDSKKKRASWDGGLV